MATSSAESNVPKPGKDAAADALKCSALDEPIAIIGIGCRLPGAVRSLQEFAEQLSSGVDRLTRLPDERTSFGSKAASSWRSSLIDDVDQFDAAFFDISAAEAAAMDPQQRLLLEVAYHALEDARYPAGQLRGADVGVFVGISADDYQLESMGSVSVGGFNPLSVTGTARSIAAGRIAYHFDFCGPVLQLDTACSSSLVAIQLACSSLRQREARLALAGGVSLCLRPEGYLVRDAIGKLTRSGNYRPFSEDADGFARGEGCGLIVLKRLADALEDRDRIHGVINAVTVRHNGHGNGISAPKCEAQRQLMRSALARAALRAGDVDFLEPHSTASKLGDSIEVRAIGDVLAAAGSTLWLGSMKGRWGHMEAAAGVVSLIKICAMLAAESLFPDAPVERLNSLLDSNKYSVRLLDRAVPWPRTPGRARRGAVNAFGLSGTNAHLIVEEPPTGGERARSHTGKLPSLVCVSGKSAPARARNRRALAHELRASSEFEALALGSCLYKDHFAYRCAFVGGSREALVEAMEASEDEALAADAAGELAFCFDGGSWTLDDVRELYRVVIPFQRELDASLSACAGELVDISWLDTSAGQPCRRVIKTLAEFAMARTWLALGVKPSLVACSGRGLLAAAALSEVISPAQMCQMIPFGPEAFAQSRPSVPAWLATREGLIRFDALTAAQLATSADPAQSWLNDASLAVERRLWPGANGQQLTANDGTPGPSTSNRDANICLGFIESVRSLYQAGHDLDFERLYSVARSSSSAELPGYRFDSSAFWVKQSKPGA